MNVESFHDMNIRVSIKVSIIYVFPVVYNVTLLVNKIIHYVDKKMSVTKILLLQHRGYRLQINHFPFVFS